LYSIAVLTVMSRKRLSTLIAAKIANVPEDPMFVIMYGNT
jgi:hypothetical protein